MKDFKEFLNKSSGRNIWDIKMAEGLIYSYPIESFGTYLSRILNAINIKHVINIKEIENTLSLTIFNFDKEVLSILNSNGNLSGYFISLIVLMRFDTSNMIIKNINDLEKNIDEFKPRSITFIFESKFDEEYKEKPRFILHVTEKKNLKKILSIGLVPKSNSKLSQHPERIYFALTYNAAVEYEKVFARNADKHIDDYDILQIDMTMLKIKLMYDPNSIHRSERFGLYTYDNIPPSAISVYKEKDI